MIRRHAARELGIVVRRFACATTCSSNRRRYVVKIYGLEVTRAEVMVSRLLAMNPGTVTSGIDGIPTTEPAFGLPALWIAESGRSDAEMAGYTVIDPTSVIATHLTEIIKAHAPDLLGRQETSALFDNVKQHYPVVIEELIPNLLTVVRCAHVISSSPAVAGWPCSRWVPPTCTTIPRRRGKAPRECRNTCEEINRDDSNSVF